MIPITAHSLRWGHGCSKKKAKKAKAKARAQDRFGRAQRADAPACLGTNAATHAASLEQHQRRRSWTRRCRLSRRSWPPSKSRLATALRGRARIPTPMALAGFVQNAVSITTTASFRSAASAITPHNHHHSLHHHQAKLHKSLQLLSYHLRHLHHHWYLHRHHQRHQLSHHCSATRLWQRTDLFFQF